MEKIFQKDEKGNIIPLFLNNINENDFKSFFGVIKELDILNCIKFLNDFIIEIKKSIELGQIIIDFNDLFQKKENGLIELIIEKYLFQEINENEKQSFENFFKYISSNFQLGKNIYDFIYRIIGKMFRFPVILENREIIFEKCIDLLNILYENFEKNPEINHDVYFYLNNNEIKIELKENNLLISDFLLIDMYVYINGFYLNKNSNILKINFSNDEIIEINLINNDNIQIKYNNEIENNDLLVLNSNIWNNLKIKIEKDKISFNINNKMINLNFNKAIESINNFIFFSKFNGIISPIIISEIEYDKKYNSISKFYIKKLFKGEFIDKKKQTKVIELTIFEDNKNQDDDKNQNSEIDQYMNNIPLILFFKKNNSKNKVENILEFVLFDKLDFPYYYSFNNLYLKRNIFLLGGVKNIFPLFELNFQFYSKDEKNFEKIFSKIIYILSNIFLFENNIEDAINSNFFHIFTLFFEKLSHFYDFVLKDTTLLFKTIFKHKNKSDIIYSDIKELLFNQKVFHNIVIQKDVGLFQFLLSLDKNKKHNYKILISIVIEYFGKNIYPKEFFDEIFEYFFNFLNQADEPQLITDIFVLINEKTKINIELIHKTLRLLIKLFNYSISDIGLEKLSTELKDKIKDSFNKDQERKETIEKEEINNDNDDNEDNKMITDKNHESYMDYLLANVKNKNSGETIFIKKMKKFLYIIEKNYFHYITSLAKINEKIIKLDLIYFLQIIIIYYLNYEYSFSKYNKLYQINHYIRAKKNMIKKLKFEQFPIIKAENLYSQIFNFSESTKNNNTPTNNNINNNKNIIINNNINKNNTNNNTNKNNVINNNNDEIENNLKLDIIDFIKSTMEVDLDLNSLDNCHFDLNDLLSYLNDYLLLIRNSQFIKYTLNKRGSEISIYDFFHDFKFVRALIPLFHHIYILNKKQKNIQLINIIQETIETLIFEIFLCDAYNTPTAFLTILDKIDWYTYENKDDLSNIQDFNNYFFSVITEKIKDSQIYNKSNAFNWYLENYFKKNFKEKYINFQIKDIYDYSIEYKNNTLFKETISYIGIKYLDYAIIQNFLIFFEIFVQKNGELDLMNIDFIFLNIFCILLAVDVVSKYSSSGEKNIFLNLVDLSINSIILKIFINNNNKKNNQLIDKLVEMYSLLVSLYYYYLIKDNIKTSFHINKKKSNEEKNKIKDDYSKIHNYFIKKNYKKIKEIILKNKPVETKSENFEKPFHLIIFKYYLNIFIDSESKILFKEFNKEEMDFLKKVDYIKNYQKLKKQLFSWNNSYSDTDLFYNENNKKKLKYKVLNHFTKEMSLPIIIPIVNLNSYIPSNLKFFKEKYLGFDIIGKCFLNLNDENDKNIQKENIQNIIYEKISNKKYKNNIFSCCLIKNGYHITGYIILEKENKYFEFIGFPMNLCDEEKYYWDIKKNICFGSIMQFNKIYYLKIKIKNITYVYKRLYAYKDDSLEIFTKDNKSYYFEFNHLFDKIFTNCIHINDKKKEDKEENKEKKEEKINNSDLEKINTNSKPNIALATELRNKFFAKIIKAGKTNVSKLRYYSSNKKYNNLDTICEKFNDNSISKLEFLTRINLYANRSFRDLNQYPIFPWIIQTKISNNSQIEEYKKEIKNPNLTLIDILLQNDNLRPLKSPMGKLTEQRFKSYEVIFETMKTEFESKFKIKFSPKYFYESKINNIDIEMEDIPIYYGSHYSNPAYVCHYLTRLFPYSIIAQLIQGNNFDSADRLFIDFNKSFYGASNIKCDLRELIPEIYFQPELFRNINGFNLGKLQVTQKEDSTYQFLKKKYNLIEDKKVRVEGVLLPDYCDDNPEKFICLMREMFERPEIKINDWIDIIFGYQQSKEPAYEIMNVYSPYYYNNFLKLDKINIKERGYYVKFFEFGIHPLQIFDNEMNKYLGFENNEIKKKNTIKIEKDKDYDKENNENDIYNKIKRFIISLDKEIQECEIQLEKETVNSNIEKIKESKEKIEKRKSELEKNTNYLNEKHKLIYQKKNYIFYNFFSGTILIIKEDFEFDFIRTPDSKQTTSFSCLDNSEITFLSIDKYFLFGTRLGSIIIYKPKKGKNTFNNIIRHHTKKIIYIEQNNILNLMISSSEDRFINIYTLPNGILVNSIYLSDFIGDQVFLSYSPLCSFIVYNKEKHSFKSFSINGRCLLKEDKIVDDDIEKMKIERDIYFIEYLICYNKNNSKVYKLPYLEEIKDDDNNIQFKRKNDNI